MKQNRRPTLCRKAKTFLKWRRTQDSNLRDPLTGPNGFQDRRHQPLGQSSSNDRHANIFLNRELCPLARGKYCAKTTRNHNFHKDLDLDFVHQYHSPYGLITAASDGTHLIGLWFDGQKHFLATLEKNWITKDLAIFKKVDCWLDQYFAGKIPNFIPPILLRTSDFQKSVAQIMQQIGYGQTITYGAIAKILAAHKRPKSMSAQAVGQAVGRNPISLIIPCHRVIGTNEKLTGYTAGLTIKKKLIDFEKTSLNEIKNQH